LRNPLQIGRVPTMERTGIEPVTSGLQTQPIVRRHLTRSDRIA